MCNAAGAAILPDAGLDGYEAAMTNFRMMSSHVFNTAELVAISKQLPIYNKEGPPHEGPSYLFTYGLQI